MTTRIPTTILTCLAAVLFAAAPVFAQSSRCEDSRCSTTKKKTYHSFVDDDYVSHWRIDRYRNTVSDYDNYGNYENSSTNDRYNDRYDTRYDDRDDSRSNDRYNDSRSDNGLSSRLRNLLDSGSRQYDDPIDSHFRQSSFDRTRGDTGRFERSGSDPGSYSDSLRSNNDRRYNDNLDYEISRRDDTRRYQEPERNPFGNRSGSERDLRPVRRRDRDPDLGRNDRRPVREYETGRPSNIDPLTPPLPRREGNDEAEAMFDRISARYQNPTLIRTVRSLSANQAVQLYREVSTQTDARHLEPSSYDLRVRKALRNLGLAMDNPTFLQALGMSSDSFQNDSFRDYLSRTWDRMNVGNRSDAEQVMQAVMQNSRSVQGLPEGVVAFEFANATIDTLDKFSALEPTDARRGAMLKENKSAALESEMTGIGVEVKEHEDGLLLMRALRGGPAAEAGLKSGDLVTAIDGRSIRGMSMAQSVDFIKGSSGSRIRLTVVRDGQRSNDVSLTRRRFRVWTVNDVRMVDGTDVGYINLSQFAQTSTQELDDALQQLNSNGMKSLVLDLRGNPGGLLTTCVDISNRFLPCGTIVSTKGRLSGDNMHEAATYTRTWNTPLVVLIDGDSASASEILAAAIQENGRGVVVGQQSYGKGTVQTHFPLQSISGNLRLTTARFYSPSGRAMSGSGVTPDVEVRDEDGVARGDRVMDRAMQIAQSRDLQEMAASAAKCRTNSQRPVQRNSFNDDIYDVVQPRTVRR